MYKTSVMGNIRHINITSNDIMMLQEQKHGDLHTNVVKEMDETGHEKVMNKYSTKNTLYHKTSLSPFTMYVCIGIFSL